MKIIVFLFFIVFYLSGCSIKNNEKEYQDQLQKINQKWADALSIANSTSRIALSQPVANLQEIKREAKGVVTPRNRKECHEHLVKYMDLTIERFLMFMQGSEIGSLSTLRKASDEYEKWQSCNFPEVTSLIKQMEAVEKVAGCLCYGVGYAIGKFNFEHPQIPINKFEMYHRLFTKNNEIVGLLEDSLKKENKKYMIPLVKNAMQREGLSNYIKGYEYGNSGGVLTETSLQQCEGFAKIISDSVTDSITKAMPLSMQSNESQEQSKKIPEDSLFVSGIIGGDNPVVVIGGKIFKEGEKIESFTIKVIENDYVEFVDQNGNIIRRKLGK